eukprot:1482605-Pyramimonas_sp.AAC.1
MWSDRCLCRFARVSMPGPNEPRAPAWPRPTQIGPAREKVAEGCPLLCLAATTPTPPRLPSSRVVQEPALGSGGGLRGFNNSMRRRNARGAALTRQRMPLALWLKVPPP